MATLDDSPSLYLGQPWSVWANKVEGKKKDGTTERDVAQPQKKDSNAMKLRKRDMSLYGHCPARDEFFLVVCETCGQVIKPQALQRHIEQRHGTKVSVCRVLTSSTQSSITTSAVLPNLTQSSHSSTKHDPHGKTPPDIPTKGGTRNATPTPPPPSNLHHGKTCSSQLSSPSKRNHSVVAVVKVERMMPSLVNSSSTSKKTSGSSSSSKSSPSSKSSSKSSPYSKSSKSSSSKSSSSKSSNSSKSSSASTRVSESPPVPKSPLTKSSVVTSVELPPPLSPIHKVPPSAMGSSQLRPSSSPAITTVATTTSTTSATPSTNGPTKPASSSKAKASKPNPNKIIPCKDREYDVNIHCGALLDETGRQCTRSLTCKTHALSVRRAVEGRRKPFDELLAEHRAAKEALLKAKAEASGKTYIPPGSKSPGSSHASSAATVAQLTAASKDHKSSSSSSGSTSLSQHSKLPKPALPLPPRPVPVPVVPKEEPVPETCSRLSSDGEEDGEDERDRLGYPHLPYHPRPAAVNNFGSRLAGNGCYVFNRRTDLLRAAFMVAVEHHLHPPPHKKLCVESKLPHGSQITTNTKDPYEFPESGQNAQFGAWGSGTKMASKAKVKPPPPAGRTIKPKDISGSRSPSGSGNPGGGVPLVGTTVNIAHPIGNLSSSGPLKRKRSSSGSANAAASLGNQSMHLGGVGTTLASLPAGIAVSESNGSPISISLPPGNLTLSAINAAVSLAGKSQLNTVTTAKNHMLKDVNIVVTSMDHANVVNGQIIGSTVSTQLANIAQLRLNQLIDKPAPGNQQRSKSHGTHNQGSKHVSLKAANVPEGASAGLLQGSMVHALAGNTVMMDQSGTVLTPIGMSPPELSPSQTANRSSSSPLSQTSPLPNGLLPSSGQLLKGVPLNHMAAAAGAMAVSPASNCSTPSPAPLDAAAPQQIQAHTKTPSGRHKKSSASSHGNPPQLAPGSAITLATSAAQSRLQPQTMFYNPVQLSGSQVPFSHIQIQPRTGGGKTTGKISMQPVSLTIPVVAGPQGVQLNTQQQQRALLLPGDDRRTHDLTQQMSNSPSNLIS